MAEDLICLCPVVEIREGIQSVTEEMMRKIARELRAPVTLTGPRGMSVVYGKHLTVCPCWTQEAEDR